METKRKNYNTTLRVDLIKGIKMLAVEKDVRANDLPEEAIQDLLKKYEKEGKYETIRGEVSNNKVMVITA
jgi:hypothetical protein